MRRTWAPIAARSVEETRRVSALLAPLAWGGSGGDACPRTPPRSGVALAVRTPMRPVGEPVPSDRHPSRSLRALTATQRSLVRLGERAGPRSRDRTEVGAPAPSEKRSQLALH
ncbi:virion protein US10 (plasmid) [Thermomicrobium roseum DSM 5159]|uniref:Virion protein US10 n=1 Tax=Thermomicrobium roseum (strain ATCC 27502 / DSM 5159 / P-2) TaxID=309801 RepID=B9L2W3_THERP|nr:virion protein US10 [Thermomicrobium roseum DSM 5159]